MTSDLFKALLLSPGTILGFIASSVLLGLVRWKRSLFFWLLAAFLNVPTCIVIFQGDGPVTSAAIIATLLIYFWGTAGLGLGLTLWLVLPARVIFEPSFWRARR